MNVTQPHTQDATLAEFVQSARQIWVYRNNEWEPVLNLSHVEVGEIFHGTSRSDHSLVLPVLDDNDDFFFGLTCEKPIYRKDLGVWTVECYGFVTLEAALKGVDSDDE
jgi:hypothetical protein